MIQAAINPETKEFLGLIIPAADLKPDKRITVYGSADDWAAVSRGESVPVGRIGVVNTEPYPGQPNLKITLDRADNLEPVEVENCPPGGQEENPCGQ